MKLSKNLLFFVACTAIFCLRAQATEEAATTNIEDQSDDAILTPDDTVFNGDKVKSSDLIAKATYQLVAIDGRAPLMEMSYCSSTLIAKDVLITAGHCIKPKPTYEMYARYSSDGKEKLIKVSEYILHKKFKEGKFKAGGDKVDYDVALIHLEGAIPGGIPARMPRADLKTPAQVVIAGFGMNGHKLTTEEAKAIPEVKAAMKKLQDNPQMSDSEKTKIAFEVINATSRNPLLSAEVKAEIFSNNSMFENPMLVTSGSQFMCGGDSGGPSYLMSANGLVIVGVHSEGVDKDKKCDGQTPAAGLLNIFGGGGQNGFGFDSYVPQYLDWIKEGVKKFHSTSDI